MVSLILKAQSRQIEFYDNVLVAWSQQQIKPKKARLFTELYENKLLSNVIQHRAT